MGKRSRKRGQAPDLGPVPESPYARGEHTLVLRAVMTPATRREYAAIGAAGGSRAAATQEDAWQRRVEFLFERLAVRWEVAGTEPITDQRELLGRLRFADAAERAWIRDALRAHLAEWFPDVEAP